MKPKKPRTTYNSWVIVDREGYLLTYDGCDCVFETKKKAEENICKDPDMGQKIWKAKITILFPKPKRKK